MIKSQKYTAGYLALAVIAILLLLYHGLIEKTAVRAWGEARAGSPLLLYAEEGDVGRVQSLIGEGADVNFRGRAGYTPLYLAVLNGHKDIAEFLILQGADPNIVSRGERPGIAPLHLAAFAGYTDIIELLVLHGAAVNMETGRGRQTPLGIALKTGREEVVELIRKHGGRLSAEGL